MKMQIEIEIEEPTTHEEVVKLATLAAIAGKVDLGDVCITRGVRENFASTFVVFCLTRHRLGDWGSLDDEDKQTNNRALTDGNRILSAYFAPNGEKLYVITERGRTSTTVLMPDEY